jgi:putative membrane protein
MGYLSWTLARVILGDAQAPMNGKRVVIVPLVAGFVMLAWDLAMDPIWGTVLHAWIWQRGGACFGVPVSNFLGWYLAVFIIFQCFAIYLRGRPADTSSLRPSYWRLAIIFYAVSAGGNLLFLIPQPVPSVVSDPVGVQWKISEIVGACAFVSIFIMGGFALLAWARVGGKEFGARADSSRTRQELQT